MHVCVLECVWLLLSFLSKSQHIQWVWCYNPQKRKFMVFHWGFSFGILIALTYFWTPNLPKTPEWLCLSQEDRIYCITQGHLGDPVFFKLISIDFSVLQEKQLWSLALPGSMVPMGTQYTTWRRTTGCLNTPQMGRGAWDASACTPRTVWLTTRPMSGRGSPRTWWKSSVTCTMRWGDTCAHNWMHTSSCKNGSVHEQRCSMFNLHNNSICKWNFATYCQQ